MSPVATETLTSGWGLGPTPKYTVIYTGKLHHHRGRYRHSRVSQARFDKSTAASLQQAQLKGSAARDRSSTRQRGDCGDVKSEAGRDLPNTAIGLPEEESTATLSDKHTDARLIAMRNDESGHGILGKPRGEESAIEEEKGLKRL